jgi:phage terminase Nu1 subunit (DNA packaging protein)
MAERADSGLMHVDMTPELRAMVARHPLPDGVPDADMSQTEIALALDVSANTVGKWLMLPDFPVAERGGQGRAHVLRLSHVWAWRHDRAAQEEDRRAQNQTAIAALQASMLNLDAPGEQGLTAKQVKEIAQADLVHSQASVQRRRLVRLEEVIELIEGIMKATRDGVEAMPDRLERELGLTPAQLEKVSAIGDDILNRIADQIEAAELNERGVTDVEIPQGVMI